MCVFNCVALVSIVTILVVAPVSLHEATGPRQILDESCLRHIMVLFLESYRSQVVSYNTRFFSFQVAEKLSKCL